MDITIFWRTLAALGVLGLLVLIIVWNGWLTPVQDSPRSFEIIILSAPLLFFVRKILHGNRDAFIMATLLSFLYSLLGIWYIYSPNEVVYGWLMLVFSLFLFFGALLTMWVLDKREKNQT